MSFNFSQYERGVFFDEMFDAEGKWMKKVVVQVGWDRKESPMINEKPLLNEGRPLNESPLRKIRCRKANPRSKRIRMDCR